jgi:hypothetical protein
MTFVPRCRVCQVQCRTRENWFLLVENDWEDRVKILSWSEALSKRTGMHAVCSPSHVQQLVAHWMATGSLDYPFARVGAGSTSTFCLSDASQSGNSFPGPGGFHVLGELAVDRESVNRLLLEDPEALVPVLDAVLDLLPPNCPGDLTGFSLVEDDWEGSALVQLRSGQTA